MSVLAKIAPAVLFLLFFSTALSKAEIKSIKIRSDNRPLILLEKFRFTHTGNITIAISAVSLTNTVSPPDPSLLGFFLLSEKFLIKVLRELQQKPYLCILHSKFITLLFNFRDLSPPPQSSIQTWYPVTNPDEYSLFFANCNPQSLVTMDVRTELYNSVDGTTKDYLLTDQTHLQSLYFIFSIIYLCFLGFWIFVCFKKQRSVLKIHLLMCVLLTMKAFSLFCESEEKHHVRVTGSHNGWNVFVYIFQFIHGVFLYSVIILIGAGWPFLKPILQGKVKKILIFVISLQVLATLASIIIRETGPYIENWVTWNQVFLFADFMCRCVVIISVVWSIRSFSKTDMKAARNLTVFRMFCVMVIGYMAFTSVGVFALKMFTVYKQLWVSSAVEETAGIVFCLVMYYLFRPLEEDEYSAVYDGGEHEEANDMVKG